MMSVPIKMIIRTESMEGLKDIFEKIEEIKKVNPYVVIETTIEIDLRSGSQLPNDNLEEKVITDLTKRVDRVVNSISRILRE